MRTALIALSCLIAMPATAQTLSANFSRWNVYRSDAGECYVASAPTRSSGDFTKRDEPYVLAVARGTSDEVNISSGYPCAESGTKLRVDGKAFSLIADRETAFAKTEDADAKLIAAMKKGNQLAVQGTSLKGTHSEDHYSLSGFTAAWKQMHQECP